MSRRWLWLCIPAALLMLAGIGWAVGRQCMKEAL